jgi:hypothetical protein
VLAVLCWVGEGGIMATKAVRKNYRRSKSRMSLSEIECVEMSEEKKRKKRAQKRADEGWEDIVPSAGRWVAKQVEVSTPGARLVRFKRKGTICDVFLELLTPAVLKACRKVVGSQRLLYQGRPITLREVYKSFAMDIYLRAIRELAEPGTDVNQLQAVVVRARKHFVGALGFNKWRFVRSNFLIDPETARTKLSRTFRRHVGFGETVTLDEKQKKFRGATPCIKKAPNKPGDNKIGHWTTQAACPLQTTSEPYVFGLYSFSGKDPADKASFENREKIWRWLVDLMKCTAHSTLPAVFADSFYLDNGAREMLQREGVLYHCSVKKNWYKSIYKHLDARVGEMGKWAGMANSKTGEVATYTWAADKGIGKKLLLSTLLKRVNGEQPDDSPPGWLLYKDSFSTCDEYNIKVGRIWWPYRIGHWTKHLDEMYHVHVLLNTLAVWKEVQAGEEERSDKRLLIELAEQLMERAHNNRLPVREW